MDSRVVPGAIVIAFLVLLLLLMYLGWRRRGRRQSDIPRPLPVPSDAGADRFSIDLFYVASTVAGSPLDRIAVAGLGFRARAGLVVRDTGVELRLAGEPDAFVPASDIRAIGRATWTIDRVVETDGLVLLAWTLGETDIDSYFRVTEPADPSELIAAISGIIAGSPGTASGPHPPMTTTDDSREN